MPLKSNGMRAQLLDSLGRPEEALSAYAKRVDPLLLVPGRPLRARGRRVASVPRRFPPPTRRLHDRGGSHGCNRRSAP